MNGPYVSGQGGVYFAFAVFSVRQANAGARGMCRCRLGVRYLADVVAVRSRGGGPDLSEERRVITGDHS